MRKGARPVAAGGLVTVMLFGAACGGGNEDPRPPAATVLTQPMPTPATGISEATLEPTATREPIRTPAPSATATPILQRTTSFGDMTFTVTDVVVSNETWRTYGGSDRQESNDSFLYVHLTVANPLEHVQLQLRSDLFFLDTGEQETEALRPWSQSASATLNPGAAINYITGFRVPDGFDPAVARLVIAEPGRVPASVVIDGPLEPPAYPIEAIVEDEASPVSAGIRCDDLVVYPVRAEIDVDAGIDAPGAGGSVDGGRRARSGERFLRIEVIAEANASTCAVRDSYFRLAFDNERLEPANHVSTSIGAGERLKFAVVFRVPVGVEDIVLLAGEPGGNIKPFPITVPHFGSE